MKAILEFNLPDENDNYIMSNNGSKYFFALLGIKNKIRELTKYGDEEQFKIGCKLEAIFNDETENINFDEIQ